MNYFRVLKSCMNSTVLLPAFPAFFERKLLQKKNTQNPGAELHQGFTNFCHVNEYNMHSLITFVLYFT